MKIGIIGRGAIGTLYGMAFYQSFPKDFCFIVDEKRKERYEESPLICNEELIRFPYCTKSTEALDFLFISTKYSGLEQAIALARDFVDDHTILCSFLNGISSEELLKKAFPSNPVIRTIVQGMDSTYLNNQVTYHLMGELIFGPCSKEEEDYCDKLEALYQMAKIPYRRTEDILLQQWNKLMFNCGLNQTCAAFYSTYGGLQNPGCLQELFMGAMKEVQAVANAKGIPLTDTDRQAWLDVLAPMSPEGMPSMRQDILAKRKSELALFSGTVVPLAKELGIEVPILEDLMARIQKIEKML